MAHIAHTWTFTANRLLQFHPSRARAKRSKRSSPFFVRKPKGAFRAGTGVPEIERRPLVDNGPGWKWNGDVGAREAFNLLNATVRHWPDSIKRNGVRLAPSGDYNRPLSSFNAIPLVPFQAGSLTASDSDSSNVAGHPVLDTLKF